MRVLIVEDEPEFRRVLEIALEADGIEFQSTASGEEGLAALRANPSGSFDIILLDVQMPGATGWDLLLQLREDGDEIPVIFITGLGAVEDRVKGLRMGADDYLQKPIEAAELLARIETVLRRRRALPTERFGELSIDLARRKVERAGEDIELSPREYDLLLALVEAKGQVVSRTQLLRDVWNLDFDPGTNVIDVHMGRLRRKVDRNARPLIETVRGQGYRLKELR